MRRRGIAILAAGASRRLGQPKQLVTLCGEPLIRRTTVLAAAVGCDAVASVLGCEAEQVEAALVGLPCERLENSEWSEGIASSIRLAVRWAELRDLAALMLLVCDQVRLSREHLLQLWAAWQADPDAPVASAYADTLGIPAIFPRSHYPSLMSLQGDRGAAKLLQARGVIQVAWPEGAHDLDTPEDLHKLSRKQS